MKTFNQKMFLIYKQIKKPLKRFKTPKFSKNNLGKQLGREQVKI